MGAKIQIVNGGITIQNLKGGVDGVSTDGIIDCDLALLAAGELAILSITNGEVILPLPSIVSATFDALVGNGKVIINNFVFITYAINETNYKATKFGSDDATITIAVMNGSITIQTR